MRIAITERVLLHHRATVSVQYCILAEKVTEAFYELTNPSQQITAHVYDVMRAELPTLELDAVFEAKEELALAVKNALANVMSGYGYSIIQVRIPRFPAAIIHDIFVS